MINISPIGRNASVQERLDYEKFDLQHQIRAKFVEALKKNFPEFGLTYASFLFHLPHVFPISLFLYSPPLFRVTYSHPV